FALFSVDSFTQSKIEPAVVIEADLIAKFREEEVLSVSRVKARHGEVGSEAIFPAKIDCLTDAVTAVGIDSVTLVKITPKGELAHGVSVCRRSVGVRHPTGKPISAPPLQHDVDAPRAANERVVQIRPKLRQENPANGNQSMLEV